jgi:hypothetical protein
MKILDMIAGTFMINRYISLFEKLTPLAPSLWAKKERGKDMGNQIPPLF